VREVAATPKTIHPQEDRRGAIAKARTDETKLVQIRVKMAAEMIHAGSEQSLSDTFFARED
jgi:hypothetical protein